MRWWTVPPLLLAAFAGGAWSVQSAGAAPRAASPYDVLDQLGRVMALVEQDHVDPVERRKLVEGALRGMVAELDPHSSYLDKDEFALFRSDTEGRFGGVGVEVDFRNQAVTVIAPIEGGPADRAGVRSGDVVLAIDGAPTAGRAPEVLVRQMRGTPGTRVTLTLRRAGLERPFEVTLTREEIRVTSVLGRPLPQGVGYLRIKQFQEGTRDELLQAVATLKRTMPGGLRGVVLDLRNDPGGLVDEAVGVADECLTEGVVYTARHRGQVVDEVRAGAGGALRHLPLVVLVNEYSASASELLAGALRDNGRAELVGARTFGKGSVQAILDLPGGAGLKLTILRYYTPSGRSIQAQGIEPDVVVGALPGGPLGVASERDLPGHLPPEAGGAAARPPKPVPGSDAATDRAADPALGVPREPPADPEQGTDEALRVAYRRLVARLK